MGADIDQRSDDVIRRSGQDDRKTVDLDGQSHASPVQITGVADVLPGLAEQSIPFEIQDSLGAVDRVLGSLGHRHDDTLGARSGAWFDSVPQLVGPQQTSIAAVLVVGLEPSRAPPVPQRRVEAQTLIHSAWIGSHSTGFSQLRGLADG
jgi:hypothetical protein